MEVIDIKQQDSEYTELEKGAISRLNECEGDPESDHIKADGILCDVLTELGFNDLVEAFQKISKWYA